MAKALVPDNFHPADVISRRAALLWPASQNSRRAEVDDPAWCPEQIRIRCCISML